MLEYSSMTEDTLAGTRRDLAEWDQWSHRTYFLRTLLECRARTLLAQNEPRTPAAPRATPCR